MSYVHLELSGGSGPWAGGAHFIVKSQPFTSDAEQGPSTPCLELNLPLHLGGRRFGEEIGEGGSAGRAEGAARRGSEVKAQQSAAVPASDTPSLL